MTHAELLRRDAELAIREGGMYYSGEYLSRMATVAESLEAENEKLRTFIDLKETCWKYVGWCDECPYNGADDERDDFNCTVQEKINLLARELGIKVNDGTK